MKKILLLVILSFSLVDFVSAQGIPPNASTIPIVPQGNCEKAKENGGLGGTCIPLPSIADNAGARTSCNLALMESAGASADKEFVGYCQGGGFFSGQRSDCCVPRNTVTPQDIARNRTTSWFSETLCETPRAQGGIGGQCLTAKSGINPLNFTDSCSSYTATPNYLGYCGGGTVGIFWSSGIETWVCCGSDRALEDLGGNTQPENIQYGDYQLLEQIPGSSNTSGRLQPYLESIYKAGFILIILGAIVMIGIGGFTYMASAGNTAMIKKGKSMITDAVVGLVVALLIWLILNIINPDLVNLQIDPLPGLNFNQTGSSGGGVVGMLVDQAIGTANIAARCNPIPDSELVTIRSEATSGGAERTTRDTAERFYQMREAAARAGIDLKVTDGYRTEEEQVNLWNQNNGVNTARPCSMGGAGSNHQQGDALDIAVGCPNPSPNGCNTSTYNWLKNNGGAYGFRNAIPTDPLHWSRSGR